MMLFVDWTLFTCTKPMFLSLLQSTWMSYEFVISNTNSISTNTLFYEVVYIRSFYFHENVILSSFAISTKCLNVWSKETHFSRPGGFALGCMLFLAITVSPFSSNMLPPNFKTHFIYRFCIKVSIWNLYILPW